MEVEEVKEEVKQESEAVVPQIEVSEIEKLQVEIDTLKLQLQKAQLERDEAQKLFLNSGKEVKSNRDYKSIVEDIE